MRRFVLATLVGGIVAILFAGTALAGGWATAEFDEALPELREGGSWRIGFTILQHGNHPVAVDGAGLRFTNDKSGAVIFYEAEPMGVEGHYLASVERLPVGTWTLEVEQGLFAPYPVGEITVGTAIATGVKTPAPKTAAPKSAVPTTASTSLPTLVPAAAVEGTGSAGILLPVAVAVAALGVGAIGIAARRRGSHSVGGGVEYPSDTSEEVA